MKITAKRAKRVWIVTRLLFVSIPLSQAIVAGVLDHDLFQALLWLAMTAVSASMILNERNAFKHGFHFGQVMIMWCMSHDVTPQEFATMPEPEPWDLPWQERDTQEPA